MRPASRKTRTLLVLAGLAVATFLIAGPALGQVTGGPVTKAGELSTARCYGHHKEEGFRSMDLFPTTITEVKRGETFEFQLVIVVPWLHELLEPVGFVNISGIPGARFPGEKEPFAMSDGGTLSPAELMTAGPVTVPGGAGGPSQAAHPFMVDANATEIVANLVGAPGSGEQNAWRLDIVSPNGAVFSSPRNPTFQEAARGAATVTSPSVRVPYSNVTQGGEGEWRAVAVFERGFDPSGDYALDLTVYYNLSKSSELLVKGERMAKRTQQTFTFEIIAPDQPIEEATLVYGGLGIAYHAHTDLNAEDYGNYTKFNVMKFRVGDVARIGTITVDDIGLDPGPVMRAYAQILGFASTFLLIPAIFLGGTFGRGSVNVLNKLLSARRRVLWHNSTSYLLLVASLAHMFLFLFENFWEWSYGLLWGGLSLAAMIGLAVTGAFQRRFVAYWGFERWRFTHFSMGMLVVGFVLVHMLADGSHLSGARIWLEGL